MLKLLLTFVVFTMLSIEDNVDDSNVMKATASFDRVCWERFAVLRLLPNVMSNKVFFVFEGLKKRIYFASVLFYL